MDCDDVIVLFAREGRTLTGLEEATLADHLDDCDACSELVSLHPPNVISALLDAGPQVLDLPTIATEMFETGELVAAGGMGKITRAFDRRLGREVALKEMLSPSLRARFEREAAITARLQHPAIVPVYEAGKWPNGGAFYTMRLVSGGTLAQAIDAKRSLAERLELLPHLVAVTDALAYAHSRRIIHRDLKPQNILVGEFGETVVIDWGLAKELGGVDADRTLGVPLLPDLTMTGSVVGTPCFMPPEQAHGDDLDERADVFALGAILYNLLAGVPPYSNRSRDTKELLEAVLRGPPTPVEELAPEAPADLRAIVHRAMARDVETRFANAGALAAELRRFAAGQRVVSRDYRMRDLVARWLKRHRAVVRIGAMSALVLAVVATIAIVKVTRAREVAEEAFGVGESHGQRKLCASEIPLLQTPWDAAARALVHRKFEQTKLPYVPQTLERVDANLDRWSAELATARDVVCPTTEVPRAQLAAELDCLGDRAREVRALISQFQEADAGTVLHAVVSTEQLAPIARCTAAVAPRVVPPDSPTLTEVRALFARSHALMDLGKHRDARPLAEKALQGAIAIGDPGIRAAALVALGAAKMGMSELDGAVTNLQAALRLAEAARDDRTCAQAWTNLVRIELWRGHYDQVLFMQSAALGAIERVGDGWLQSETMLNIGGALSQLGKLAEAQALFEQAVALRRKLFGDRDGRVAAALSSLGNAYSMQGNLDSGIAAHREAVAIAEAALGSSHPNVAIMHGNLGDDYTYGLRAAEAVTELEGDLSVLEAADGPKHRDVAMALTDLALARLEAGQLAAAADTFDRAEALWHDLNPKHPARAEALLGRYLALQALGKPVGVADLELALTLGTGLPPFERARIQFTLGKASTGPRATELVKAAIAGFATSTLPLCQRELAAAKAWLAAHP